MGKKEKLVNGKKRNLIVERGREKGSIELRREKERKVRSGRQRRKGK